MSERPPPPEISHLLAAIGEGPLLLLIERYAGTRIYVPSTPVGAATLERVVGSAEAAAKLVEALSAMGAEVIRVPLAKAWRARIYHGRGMSQAEIALKLGCNEVTVWKYLHDRGGRADPRMTVTKRAAAPGQMSLALTTSPDALTPPCARAEDGRRDRGQIP